MRHVNYGDDANIGVPIKRIYSYFLFVSVFNRLKKLQLQDFGDETPPPPSIRMCHQWML